MADYITLLGYEQVQRAASSMANSAEEMQRAASTISEALDAHNRNFLPELERILREDREARIADLQQYGK